MSSPTRRQRQPRRGPTTGATLLAVAAWETVPDMTDGFSKLPTQGQIGGSLIFAGVTGVAVALYMRDDNSAPRSFRRTATSPFKKIEGVYIEPLYRWAA
jgi:hypothetical protein